MEADAVTTLLSLAAPFLAAGAAYGGVKAGLNGIRLNVASIEKICTRLDEKVGDHGERITALEVETVNLKERADD